MKKKTYECPRTEAIEIEMKRTLLVDSVTLSSDPATTDGSGYYDDL